MTYKPNTKRTCCMACGSDRLFVSIIIISIHQVMPWPKSLQGSYIDSSSENEWHLLRCILFSREHEGELTAIGWCTASLGLSIPGTGLLLCILSLHVYLDCSNIYSSNFVAISLPLRWCWNWLKKMSTCFHKKWNQHIWDGRKYGYLQLMCNLNVFCNFVWMPFACWK